MKYVHSNIFVIHSAISYYNVRIVAGCIFDGFIR